MISIVRAKENLTPPHSVHRELYDFGGCCWSGGDSLIAISVPVI